MKSIALYFINFFRDIKIPFREVTDYRAFTLRKRSSDFKLFAETFYRYFPEDFLSLLKSKSLYFDEESVIIDIGAYNGATTLLFRTHFPHHYIIAIEANKDNFLMLSKNLRGMKRVSLLNFAVDSTHALVTSTDSGQGYWGFQTTGTSQRSPDTIEGRSVKEIIPDKFPGEKRFFIKVDIEGGERFLIADDWNEIVSFEVICIEFHDWLFPKDALTNLFWKALLSLEKEFSLHIRGNNIWIIKL